MPFSGLKTNKPIAFQGETGAFSHKAVLAQFGNHPVLSCASFEEALDAVKDGLADLAMIPIENSTAGRVADIHILLPESGLFIVGEHFETVSHCLVGLPEAEIEDIAWAFSHVQALGQCRKSLKQLGIRPRSYSDTAAAARHVAESGRKDIAAICSELAADVYGLKILQKDLQDENHNTTRFVILAREELNRSMIDGPAMTSLTFKVRNVPASLFKALGGFATNGVNMTKLESYYDAERFQASEFFLDIEGAPGDPPVDRALEELRYFSKEVRLLGTFPQARSRQG